MLTMTFIATMESDVIISETSTTAGTHSSLDYIPGACFLGACAAKIYGSLSQDEAFAIFHSGKVRFGNAYPLSASGIPSLPVPAAWHYFKGESFLEEGKLNVLGIKNLLHTSGATYEKWAASGRQPKQMRDGYATPDGAIIGKSSEYRLKTAIDRKGKRAAEGQLFGYESLNPGSRWWFSIDIDGDIPKNICEDISSALIGRIRVGRSRTAENGIVKVDFAENVVFAPALAASENHQIHIYCVSDIALRDSINGTPVTVPAKEHFQLPDGVRLAADRSFIRTRRYAPFNGKRKANDLERQVICKGSVSTFAKDDGSVFTEIEISAIRQKLIAGVGMYRHDGLGKVLVNPTFIMSETVALQETVPVAQLPEQPPTEQPDSTRSLIDWLTRGSSAQSDDADISKQVEEWANLLVKNISNLNRMGSAFPGNSQWGAVRSIASLMQTTREMLVDKLFGENIGLCVHGVSRIQWEQEFKYDHKWISFAEFLRTVVVAQYNDHEQTRKALYLLAERVPKKLNQHKEGK